MHYDTLKQTTDKRLKIGENQPKTDNFVQFAHEGVMYFIWIDSSDPTENIAWWSDNKFDEWVPDTVALRLAAQQNPSETFFYCVGYKGDSPMDAGVFYCPYVPLQMVRAVDSSSFQPQIAFKTRYGLVANPFAENASTSTGRMTGVLGTNPHLNVYYRKAAITNLM